MVTREEFEELKRLVLSLITREDKRAMYDRADKGGIRQTESNHGEQIEVNSEGISENDTAICDVADLSDVNSQAIDDLAEMVDELSNKVAEKEEC